MTPRTARRISTALIVLAFVLLALELASLAGWIRRNPNFWFFAMICVLFSMIVGRRAASASPTESSS